MLSKAFLKDVETLHNDTQSGAAAIAEISLSILKKECLRLGDSINQSALKTGIQLLLDTHPIATIENALLPIYAKITQLIRDGELKNDSLNSKIELLFATRREQLRIGEKNTINTLIEEIREKNSLLTFSHSSTIIKALLQLAREGYNDKEIFILESRPLKEGERTAYSLANAGFKNTNLGIDFCVHEFTEFAEVAILGADMIQPNGNILNKIGSATVAELFHNRSKDVIIAASPAKICLRGLLDYKQKWQPMIPHRNIREVTNIKSPNLHVWNKYFEIINPEWISILILDNFRFIQPISEKLREYFDKDPLASEIHLMKKNWWNVDFSML